MKTTILFSALPVLSVLAGLGSGFVFADEATPAVQPAPASTSPSATEPMSRRASNDTSEKADLDLARDAEKPGARVVQLGRITVPIQKARTVSYVAADLGVAMQDAALAEAFREPQAGLRLRSAVLAALVEATALPIMQGADIDTEALSGHLERQIIKDFEGVEDVLFLSFQKSDVPRA
ncbi:hypothetical protein OCH239_00310 [Roseivivax halodurans JCM 10272]|uniref:Flagellar protein FliL n=1 Tax=Roseivivax halodurans JCM 10272 TaxID=1449350 RepID=X7ENF4_9RHOB|nr:hypothetical protein [Roseivivax halodurans]ETX16703.1 hypothetical protein OCH239_00310 [Roseivivax halodurans JCM 10272]